VSPDLLEAAPSGERWVHAIKFDGCVGIQTLSSSGHLYVAIMAAHVGLDPREDINWVTSPTGNAMELFAERNVARLRQCSRRLPLRLTADRRQGSRQIFA
jgi:hypothetical protein